jgi:hypothetical protein
MVRSPPSDGHSAVPAGTERHGQVQVSESGDFVPRIVPAASFLTDPEAWLPAQTPATSPIAEDLAKVRVAGSNPVVRSKVPGYRAARRLRSPARALPL